MCLLGAWKGVYRDLYIRKFEPGHRDKPFCYMTGTLWWVAETPQSWQHSMFSITNRNKGFIREKNPITHPVCHFRMIYTQISSSTDLQPPSGMGLEQLYKHHAATLNQGSEKIYHYSSSPRNSWKMVEITFHPQVYHVSPDKCMPGYLQCPSTFEFFVLCPPKEGPTIARVMEEAILSFQLNSELKIERSECYDWESLI